MGTVVGRKLGWSLCTLPRTSMCPTDMHADRCRSAKAGPWKDGTLAKSTECGGRTAALRLTSLFLPHCISSATRQFLSPLSGRVGRTLAGLFGASGLKDTVGDVMLVIEMTHHVQLFLIL